MPRYDILQNGAASERRILQMLQHKTVLAPTLNRCNTQQMFILGILAHNFLKRKRGLSDVLYFFDIPNSINLVMKI
jgi:hypothetical protein